MFRFCGWRYFFSNNGAYTIKIYSSACTLLWDGVEIKHGRIFKQEAVSRSLWELLVASVAAVTCRQADVVHAKLQSNDVGRDCRLCTRDWPDHPRAQRDSPGAARTDQTTHELNLTHLGATRTDQTSHELNVTHPGAAPTDQTTNELVQLCYYMCDTNDCNGSGSLHHLLNLLRRRRRRK